MEPAARTADPRPARTRAAIAAAVEQLCLEPGSDVSVNAIVRLSGVSRSAFYAQFSGLDDLAVAMLVDAIRDIGIADLEARRHRDGDLRTVASAALARLVRSITSRRAFFRASLDWRLTSRVHEVVVAAYARQVGETMRALGPGVPAALDRADTARFVAGGAVSLLTTWLRDEVPPAEAEQVERLLAVLPPWLVGGG